MESFPALKTEERHQSMLAFCIWFDLMLMWKKYAGRLENKIGVAEKKMLTYKGISIKV